MSAAAEAAEALAAAGVRAAFGVTGSGVSWQIISALEARGVRYFPAAHEAAAAIMAGAHARQSGTLGCSVTIKGPGFANMTAGILSNRYEQWPAISISEAYDWSQPSARMHKRLDQRAMALPIVKDYAASIAASEIGRLCAMARAEAPGPVHLDFAGSESAAAPNPDTRTDPHGAWDAVRRRLESCERPVVIAGSLATRHPIFKRLNELRIPVFTTVAAKGCIDERLASAAGVFTGDGKALAPEAALFADCDLVVGFGLRTTELLSPAPFAAGLVTLDVAGESAMTAGLAPEASMTRATYAQLVDALDALGGKSWGLEDLLRATARMRARLLDGAFLPAGVFDAIQNLGGDTTLVVDTGLFCTVAEHVWRARRWTNFVASANGRFMGTALPMSIGQAIARPTDRTVCVMGDGGVRPFWAELALAIRERLPVLFVLMSDARYGSVASAASIPGLSARAVDVPVPSWFRAAEALGCPAVEARSLEAFVAAASAWRFAEGPMFIETPFEPAAYGAMTAELR